MLIKSDEAGSDGTLRPITRAGDTFWLCKCEFMPATAYRDSGHLPDDVKVFESKEAAEEFLKTWKPHPWFCKPLEYRILAVKPKMVQQGVELI